MSKIKVSTISGAQDVSRMNDNFKKIEQALNDGVMWRRPPKGEPNDAKENIDLNGNRIYNLPEPVEEHEPLRKKDFDPAAVNDAIVDSEAALELAKEVSEKALLRSGSVFNAEGRKISSVSAPSAMDDAANKAYVVQEISQLAVDGSGAKVVERLADGTTTGNGAGMVRFQGITVNDRLSEEISLKDFSMNAKGSDWSDAIDVAESVAFLQGFALKIPSGEFGYSRNHTFRCEVRGAGVLSTRLIKLAPATITVLRGNFSDMTIGPKTRLASDSSEGLVADGLDRKFILDVMVENHGGDGFVFKRGNLSRFSIRSRGNNGRGVFFAKEPLTGDNKACEFWFEITNNGLNGFEIEDSTNLVEIGAAHTGSMRNQNNGRLAVAGQTRNTVLTGNAHNLVIYDEYATGPWHKGNLTGSIVFYSNMSHTTFLNEGNTSNTVSYIPSGTTTRSVLVQRFDRIILAGSAALVGTLDLQQTADRAFTLDAAGSTATQELRIGSTLNLTKNGRTYGRRVGAGATLNFSSIPAHSTVTRTITLPSDLEVLPTNVAVTCSPRYAVPEGIMWSAWVESGAPTAVSVRVANITPNAITVPQGAWNILFSV